MKAKLFKPLFVSIVSLSACAFIIGATTFAWFNYNKNVEKAITIDSGSVEIVSDQVKVTAYKYCYPAFDGSLNASITEDVINYDGIGKVFSYDLLTSSIYMNKYDPFYLNLNPNLTVKDLMTNVGIKFEIPIKTTTSINVKLKAAKMTGIFNDPISDHLDFCPISVSQFAASSAVYGGIDFSSDDSSNAFYRIKNYAEPSGTWPTFQTFIGSSNNSIDLYNASIVYAAPSSSSTSEATSSNSASLPYMYQTLTFYVNIEYNPASLDSYTNSLKAGASTSFPVNCYFLISAEQQ